MISYTFLHSAMVYIYTSDEGGRIAYIPEAPVGAHESIRVTLMHLSKSIDCIIHVLNSSLLPQYLHLHDRSPR